MAVEFENDPNTESLASVASFTPPASLASFSFWVNLTSLVANIRRFFGTATNFEIRAGNAGGTTPAGATVNDFYNNSDGAIASTLLTVGTWFHVAGRGELDGVPNSITDVFINGVLDAGPTTIAGAAVAAATMTIGNRTGMANTQGTNGLLADLRVYNRQLTPEEIQTIFQTRGVDGIVDGLVLRAFMDEGPEGGVVSGTGVVKDLSDNKNNYTPTGSPAFEPDEIRSRRRVA